MKQGGSKPRNNRKSGGQPLFYYEQMLLLGLHFHESFVMAFKPVPCVTLYGDPAFFFAAFYGNLCAEMLAQALLCDVHIVGLPDVLLLRFLFYFCKLRICYLGGFALHLAHGPAVYCGVVS